MSMISILNFIQDNPVLAGTMAFVFGFLVLIVLMPGFRFKFMAAFCGRLYFPYCKANLFTPAEKKFFSALDKSVGNRFRIFAKVRIADAITIPDSLAAKFQGKRAFFKIAAKHFDFVLCDVKTFETLAAIELDDNSHSRRDRKERDVFVDYVCQFAKLPLIRIKASNYYDFALLREKILTTLCHH